MIIHNRLSTITTPSNPHLPIKKPGWISLDAWTFVMNILNSKYCISTLTVEMIWKIDFRDKMVVHNRLRLVIHVILKIPIKRQYIFLDSIFVWKKRRKNCQYLPSKLLYVAISETLTTPI